MTPTYCSVCHRRRAVHEEVHVHPLVFDGEGPDDPVAWLGLEGQPDIPCPEEGWRDIRAAWLRLHGSLPPG